MVIEFVNSSGETLTGQTLTITLTEGVSFLPGSLDTISGQEVNELDLSDLNAPILSLDSRPAGEAVQFQISYSANPSAMDFVENGGTPRHTILLETDQGALNQQSPAFNILYAALNLITINPVS